MSASHYQNINKLNKNNLTQSRDTRLYLRGLEWPELGLVAAQLGVQAVDGRLEGDALVSRVVQLLAQ